MAFHILDEVKKRPRNEWQALFRERWTRLRIWIQENGEAAFCLGLGIGFLLVVFHKVFIFLLALGVIVFGVMYLITPTTEEFSSKSDTANIGGSSPLADQSEEEESAHTTIH